MSTFYAKYTGASNGGGGGVTSLNSLSGALTLVAGSGISITPSGTNITIATTPTNAITALTGDVVAMGPGSVNASLVATTNSTLVTLSALSLPASQLTGLGNLTDVGTDGIVITNGTGAVIGAGTSIAQHVADTTHNGYLSSTDWNTFNSKQPAGSYITALTGDGTATGPGSAALTLATVNANVGSFTVSSVTVNAKGLVTAASSGTTGDLTDIGTDGITVTGGTGAVLGTGTSLSQHVADTTHNGYLSSTDWNTFNGKTSGGITALTGDVTASGPGSAAATLATVNANIGTFASVTVNGKGLVTAAAALSGDATTSGSALTLATVNANTGSFGSSTSIPSFTVNGKGLITAASGNVVIAPAGTLTGTTLASNVVTSSLTSLGVQSQALNMGSNLINNVTTPVSAQDAATKSYVDAAVAALNPATAVYAASTATIPGTYNNGVSGVGAFFTTTSTSTFTIDGTTPSLGARLLFKDQTSGFQNGIYTFTTLPVGGVSGAVFTRALDYDTASDMNSAGLIPVINGTTNALSSWQQVATITTVGTDALVFTEFTANPSLYLLKANNLSDVASKSASFDNLSPMTTGGDIIYGGASGTGTRLANGSSGQFLTSNGGTSAPSWTTPSSSGTVTTVSVVSANGLAGTVANATTTPAITLSTSITGILKGNGTAISAGTSGTDYSAGTSGLATGILKSTTGTGALTIAVAGDFPALPYASSTLTNTHLFVGNGSNVATDVAASGDLTLANTGAFTFNTVNTNTGSFGSSTAIPSFTVNGKGLITAASTNAVIAPAGTLTGTTLASNVVTSSLTTVGTIGTGTWQGTAVGTQYGGTGQNFSASTGAISVASGVMSAGTLSVANGGTGQTSYTDGQLLIGNTSGNTLTKATLTAGSGIVITNGNGSISVASTGTAGTAFNTTSQTTTYNAAANDYVIASGASFTITLPTAVGIKGQVIVIEHNGTSLTQVYTLNTTSAQTIGGVASGSYALYTKGETLTLVSDNANWQIQTHITNTGSVSAGAISISATAAFVFSWTGNQNIVIGSIYQDGSGNLFTVAVSTNTTTGTFSGPTNPATTGTLTLQSGTGVSSITWTSRTVTGQPVFGTTTTNVVEWSRSGLFATVRYLLVQTGAGTAGSQDYIFYLPTGLEMDTTVVPAYPTGPNLVLLNNAGSFASMVPSTGAATQQTGQCVGPIGVAYSSKSFRFTGGTSSVTNIGSGNIALSGGNVGYYFNVTIPILNWQA